MSAYYNENDAQAAEWLRELIKAGVICEGEVDERSIVEVRPEDLRGFAQHHFFAGIGVWSYALRKAGWPDDSSVWTGSCPCQPFSASGKGEGFSDERHLWPAWFGLIREFRPVSILGEQVANKGGLAWFDIVSADLEREGYAVGACDTCAAGFGAPQISQRLYFLATTASQSRRLREGPWQPGQTSRETPGSSEAGIVAETEERTVRTGQCEAEQTGIGRGRFNDGGEYGGLGPASGERAGRNGREIHRAEGRADRKGQLSRSEPDEHIDAGRDDFLGETGPSRLPHSESENVRGERRREKGRATSEPSPVNGFWRGADWVLCRTRDPERPEWRPVEPGTFPLAYGIAGRVGLLRGYGNALVAPQATAFIEACIEVMK